MNRKQVVKRKAEQILDSLSIEGELLVEEKDDIINVSIDTKDSSLLIGYHGENLESLQLILSFLVQKELGEFKRILVNVGDYRERREEKLKELASQAKEEALQKGGEVVLPNLLSSERRIIHLFLQNDKEVSSESMGEGNNRQLIIKPKRKRA